MDITELWVLGQFFLEPVIFAATQCLCCSYRRPKEDNIFRVLPMASGRCSTIPVNTMRTGLLNRLNALSRGLIQSEVRFL